MLTVSLVAVIWLVAAACAWALCVVAKKCDEALEDVEFYRPIPRRTLGS